MDAGCEYCAECIEGVTPLIEWVGDVIWCLGSPIAFPIIFFFDPETDDSGGWDISMLQSPTRKPIECCLSTICPPCGQWYLRRQVLGGDMSKYKLWQGHHDGPQCLARKCPGAPITIESGTYGEDKCPELFLCAEVWCLGGVCSTCCAFNVSRRMMKEQYGLGSDPTEIRQEKCTAFFEELAHKLWCLSCCVGCTGCIISCFAPEGSGADQCGDAAQRCSGAGMDIVWTCWRGIASVKMIAIGCMSAQMLHEQKVQDDGPSAPSGQKMDRR